MTSTTHAPDELLGILVEGNVLSPAAAEQVRTRIHDAWQPIGGILRGKGKLSMPQLMDLLQVQSVHPHLRLGELAVRQGYCTAHDVLEALRSQRESAPHLLDFVVDAPGVDPGCLCRALARYVHLLEARLQHFPAEA